MNADESGDQAAIVDLSKRYLRAIDEHEAAKEEFLAGCAQDYYRPGYLEDDEWELLKRLVQNDADREKIMVVIEIAIWRKVATELGRADEFEPSWPAKRRQAGGTTNGGP